MQIVLAVVMVGEGRPVCTAMWFGNTADITVLLPIIDRLRARIAIGRVCVVADRGTISEATPAWRCRRAGGSGAPAEQRRGLAL